MCNRLRLAILCEVSHNACINVALKGTNFTCTKLPKGGPKALFESLPERAILPGRKARPRIRAGPGFESPRAGPGLDFKARCTWLLAARYGESLYGTTVSTLFKVPLRKTFFAEWKISR